MEKEIFANETTAAGRAATLPDTIPTQANASSKNVLGKTQAEVKEKLKTAISESQRLDISKAGNYTVAAWVRTWYEVYAEPRIRPNTKEYYANYIENHIVPGIGEIMLDKLTTIQIQRFYNNLQKKWPSPAQGIS